MRERKFHFDGKLEVPNNHPSEDTNQGVNYMNVKFKGQVQTKHNLGVNNYP